MVHEAELRHILIVQGDERPVLVGAGDGPCVIFCASSPEYTQDGSLAYARFAPRDTRYRPGPLPE
jgi:hypothetical protein